MLDMKKFDKRILGPDCDTAISSRVRLARNFADYPFPARLNDADRIKIIDSTAAAVKSSGYNFETLLSSSLSASELTALTERRLISRDFSAANGTRALIYDTAKNIYIMVNEEDHLRIQAITPGMSVDEAYAAADAADDLIGAKIKYAFNEKLGYLTHCPTNLGTGMRMSVMLHLPALSLTGAIKHIIGDIAKIGLTIRGTYGEGTESAGQLYQISNQITLGATEKETAEKLKLYINKIIDLERDARNNIKSNALDTISDKILRSYGIIRHAHMISSNEFMDLYSHIRLGITYGIIKDIDYKTIDFLMTAIMPENITIACSGDNRSRDVLRAEFIRKTISKEI